ncbi:MULTISPECIES: serine hydrolase domain-containing protein [Paracoccaceae]|jgi:CubicO group peptidase (beta-lactamase class C family)|uniref:serine hydrolase domain-containing protein n=1 Tax=Rhodobacterales TaxID=204455 RepID=UPI001B033144|nr:serine hydrolase domain-containing protein [Boseongicola sp. H5]MBO6602803.1 beta-lactamase family protein [Roseicyclus sp.]MBO6625230.1 beta-lactamase family protein [Roseicyclus sp.]MBO6923670.1 beta-lactamase family protein [Roseicyclus sp.]
MTDLHWARIDADGTLTTGGDPGAIFPFWSFTKTAIAATALSLAETGRIALDAPLSGAPYTLRQLLRHTSGLPDYGALPSYHDAVARGDTPWAFSDVLARSLAHTPVRDPLSQWRYSNIGYRLALAHMETETGQRLGYLIKTMFSTPLDSTTLRFARSPDGFAGIHWPEGRGYDPGWVYHRCLIGTSADAARLLRLILAAHPDMGSDAVQLGDGPAGRPWTHIAYGTGVMCGRMGPAGTATGHSGLGPFSANAVYHFPDLAGAPTVATFTPGAYEGPAEQAAVDIARGHVT